MNRGRQHIFSPAWWLAIVATLVALYACVRVEPEKNLHADPQAVTFGAYLSRGVATRAGDIGVLDLTSLQTAGFGVFGYHTVNARYSYTDEPDFMYNTQVTNPSGSAWIYSPIKYWPNQYGTGANSDLVDRVSFFAYAPHVAVDPEMGELSAPDDGTPANSHTTGIIRLSRAIDKGAPSVTYKASFFPGESVDLCWGVPHLNVERPVADVSTPVTFQFNHALAALNMQVDSAIDELSPGSNTLDSGTRIYVRYISLEGCAQRGVLNLNSAAGNPEWRDYYGETISHTAVTVHDGRLDGLEASYADSMESPTGLNAEIVQQVSYNAKDGVTNTSRNLFDSNTLTDPVFVIPNGYPLRVTIEYDVETRDDKLTGSVLGDGTTHGSVTRVCVRQLIATGPEPIRMQAGTKYVLRLHLGMTSVKFEAGMTDDWTVDDSRIVFRPVTMGQEVVTHTITGGDWY